MTIPSADGGKSRPPLRFRLRLRLPAARGSDWSLHDRLPCGCCRLSHSEGRNLGGNRLARMLLPVPARGGTLSLICNRGILGGQSATCGGRRRRRAGPAAQRSSSPAAQREHRDARSSLLRHDSSLPLTADVTALSSPAPFWTM
jgi:hypothetical protein